MKGKGLPSKILIFDAIQVTKQVHSIGPVILKFVSHCLTIAFAEEIRILLTMAYNIINSSLRTVRGLSLGKRVMATNEESDFECHCTGVQTCHEQLDPKLIPKTHVD